MLERFYLIYNVLITLRFLTLCASVGNKRGFSIVDARCNHEVYRASSLASNCLLDAGKTAVGNVNRLRAGPPMNSGSFPGRGKEFPSL